MSDIRQRVTPGDYQFKVHGSYYKVGRFGKVFIWLEFWWKASTKTLDEVLHPVDYTGNINK